ncbi:MULTISPECIES: TIGR00730 family Rossman fold protein [Thalassospira]|uniref:Cytokinin riboside 5'-monophosphate phosphoribohydrolase n=1 Tax=Thalassospira lohafexi TaxID=744227 RepID=A0A2N3L638_9PROT|nr:MULTISPECIES: TIGR00730 family Rossman fold protein [Thalassospira]MBV16482.1 TIGR00730 family Rossman fold protein [Thalassospira sp.]PKR58313.1 TIGR00730 family Rossman fold protein [Thalassospira lohafexi]RCK29377.1 lysine decarboxylase [Thalassospira lucentensis MCCC 1A00383 = DSM 14000]|tara:strand:+ start:38466 stop:39050 length:585 start_codon:yes stop_codon:yes gene_type:complete
MTNVKSICVFCGASDGKDPRHMENAIAFGKMMAERGITLIYGGGRIGLMGAVADAVMKNGGKVVGIIPAHLDDIEVGHTGLSELIVCKSMHERKVEMFKRSDAFVTLAGGLGSLDEAFEAMTLRQLGIHDTPMVFFNALGYWDKCLAMIDGIIADGFARESHKNLFTVADTLDEIFEQLAAEPAPKFDPREKLF